MEVKSTLPPNLSWVKLGIFIVPFVKRAFFRKTVQELRKGLNQEILPLPGLRALQLFVGTTSVRRGEALQISSLGRALLAECILKSSETFFLPIGGESLCLRVESLRIATWLTCDPDLNIPTESNVVEGKVEVSEGRIRDPLNCSFSLHVQTLAKSPPDVPSFLNHPKVSHQPLSQGLYTTALCAARRCPEPYDFIEDKQGWWLGQYLDAWRLGTAPPYRGIVLSGPSGTGKTLLMYHISALLESSGLESSPGLRKDGTILPHQEASSHSKSVFTIHCSLHDIISPNLELTQKRLQFLFNCAKVMSPTLLILDDTEDFFVTEESKTKKENSLEIVTEENFGSPLENRLFLSMLASFLNLWQYELENIFLQPYTGSNVFTTQVKKIALVWITRELCNVPPQLFGPSKLSVHISLLMTSTASHLLFLQHLGKLYGCSWAHRPNLQVEERCEHASRPTNSSDILSTIASRTKAWNRSELKFLLRYKKVEDALRFSRSYFPTTLRKIPHVNILHDPTQNVSGGETAFVDYCNAWKQIKTSFLDPLRNRESFDSCGLHLPRGILIHGSTGRGKTFLLAKLCAYLLGTDEFDKENKTSNVPRSLNDPRGGNQDNCEGQMNPYTTHVMLVDATSMISKYVGQSERNLRELFATARNLSPTVLLIDRFERIARRREVDETCASEQLLTTFLHSLDELQGYPVTIVATVDSIDELDPAVLGVDRFEINIKLSLPRPRHCLEIARKLLSILPSSVNEKSLCHFFSNSRFLSRKTAADIAHIIYKASWRAISRNASTITDEDVQAIFHEFSSTKHRL